MITDCVQKLFSSIKVELWAHTGSYKLEWLSDVCPQVQVLSLKDLVLLALVIKSVITTRGFLLYALSSVNKGSDNCGAEKVQWYPCLVWAVWFLSWRTSPWPRWCSKTDAPALRTWHLGLGSQVLDNNTLDYLQRHMHKVGLERVSCLSDIWSFIT